MWRNATTSRHGFSLKYLFGTWWICVTVTAYYHCIKQNWRAVSDVNLKLRPNLAAEDTPPRFTLPLLWCKRGILLSSKASSASAFWSFHPLHAQKLCRCSLSSWILFCSHWFLASVFLFLPIWWQMAKHLNSWRHFIASSFWCFVAFYNYLKNAFKSRGQKSLTLCKWLDIHD